MVTMKNRIRILGAFLVCVGVALAGAGFLYGLDKANAGLGSAAAMYASQGVALTYNDQGQLTSGGTTDEANAIMTLLEKDWAFPVNHANFNAKDPIINTRDEVMFQYATITYHVLHQKVAVTLTDKQVPITYRDVTYSTPGTYQIEVQKYYAQLDRTNPIESQLRSTAWSPTALALTGQLAAAHANQGVGELAQATSLAIGGLGAVFALTGVGIVWVSFGRDTTVRGRSPSMAANVSLVQK